MTRRAAILLFVLYLTTAFLLTHLPGESLPQVRWSVSIPGLDKIVHAGLYFFLAAFFANCLRFRVKSNRVVAGLTMTALSGYAAFDEWAQQFSANRSPDFFDFVADLTGASFGVSLFSLLRWFRRRMLGNSQAATDGVATVPVNDALPITEAVPTIGIVPANGVTIELGGTAHIVTWQTSAVDLANQTSVETHTPV